MQPACSQVFLVEKQVAPAIYPVSYLFSLVVHSNAVLLRPGPRHFQEDRSENLRRNKRYLRKNKRHLINRRCHLLFRRSSWWKSGWHLRFIKYRLFFACCTLQQRSPSSRPPPLPRRLECTIYNRTFSETANVICEKTIDT